LQDLEPKRLPGARAVLTASVRSPAGKRSFLRGILDPERGTVRPVLGQASHQLASLAKANALIIVKERFTEMTEGEIADVLELP
jgi:molybdopterin molybdotransferase